MRYTRRAMHLDSSVDNTKRHIRHRHFDLRNSITRGFIADSIHEIGRLKSQKPTHFDFDTAICDHIIVTAEFGERLTKRLTADCALAHKFERLFRRAN